MRRFALWLSIALAVLAAAPALAQAFDPVQAANDYLATVAGEARERSDSYFEGGYWLILFNALVVIAACWLLLTAKVSARIRAWVERKLRFRPLVVFVYALAFFVVLAAVTFPYVYWRDFIREHDYGLLNQDFFEWFKEFLISVAVNAVGIGLMLVAIYAVIRRAPKTWWMWTAGVMTVFLAVGVLIAPLYIAPLFNDYQPMAEGALKDEILAMARANGVPADNVYTFDASRQSDRISANVSGLLGTMRISLTDNLIERGTVAEVKAVMGHELGHYVLNHTYKFLVFYAVLFFIGGAFVSTLFKRWFKRSGEKAGVRGLDDPAGLPALFAFTTLYFFLMFPVFNTITRVQEAEADIFGLNAAQEPDGFATVALKLAQYRKLEPTPEEEWVFYDHPSGRSRILMAMRWKAEHLPPVATPDEPAPSWMTEPGPAGTPAPPPAESAPANTPE